MRSLLTPESEFGSAQTGTLVAGETEFLARSLSIELSKGAIYSQHIEAGNSIQITALSGASWITQEGDPEDYVLEHDTTSIFTGPGLLVVEGLLETNSFTVASFQTA